MPNIKKAELRFNIERKLPQSYGHKLRGFFAEKFEEVLFHHHKGDGDYMYSYPLIQYKIIEGIPVVISLAEGVDLIKDKFLDVEKLTLSQEEYRAPEIQLKVEKVKFTVVETDQDMLKFKYDFITPWLGLNQNNFNRFMDEIIDKERQEKMNFLSEILIGNILSCAKKLDWWVEKEIKVVPSLDSVNVKFKNQKMLGFKGKFYSNVRLPSFIGLGQSTARGFGTINRHRTF